MGIERDVDAVDVPEIEIITIGFAENKAQIFSQCAAARVKVVVALVMQPTAEYL